ncbi:hypothetical protein SN15_05735 [Stenotrophomonas maltophilia]|nr:hypothetical protein SN15_05735 [Stenotrophomonas maltophilia]
MFSRFMRRLKGEGDESATGEGLVETDPSGQARLGQSSPNRPSPEELSAVLERVVGPGLDADFKHRNGDTPLHYAANQGDIEACRVLLGAGADVNAKGQTGMTPLHWAVRHEKDLADFLLEAGADPTIRDDYKRLPGYMDRALHEEQTRHWQADFQPRTGVDSSELIFQARNADDIKAALKQGASVRDTDPLGRNPLHYAQNGEVVVALSHAGADFSAVDAEGNTPFHTAGDEAMGELYQCSGMGTGLYATTANKQGEVPYDSRDFFEYHRLRDDYEEEEARLQSITENERSSERQASVLNVLSLINEGDAKKLLETVDPNAELVSQHLSYDIDGNEGWRYNDYAGYSVIHAAAASGNVDLCRELVFAGADWTKTCELRGEQGFDDRVNGFHNEPGMRPVDFAANNETRNFFKNAEQELHAHNRAKHLESSLPPAHAWKPPEGGFAADAQRQVQTAMAAQGSLDGQSQEAPRQRPRF